MKHPEFRHYDIERLSGIVLTGFPLEVQRSALLSLLEKACFSYTEISSLAVALEKAKGIEEIKSILANTFKKKNEVLKEVEGYLNS